MEINNKRKRAGRRLAYVLASLLLALAFLVPMASAEVQAAAKTPKTTVSKKTLYLGNENATYQIRFKNLAKSAKVTYTTADKKIAKVSSKGVITAVAKGKTTITVKITQNKKTYTSKIAVTVKKPYVWLSNKTTKLVQGSDFQLIANPYGLVEPKLKYSSKNVLVAKIDAETGMIHARGAGKTTITVTDKTSGTSVSFTLKVVERTEENFGEVYIDTAKMDKEYVYTAPKDTEGLSEAEVQRIEYLTDIQDRITKGRSITMQEMTDYYEEKRASENESEE
ncbi:MAG: Ig-like domain-containing protein [Lachnospiraceae bacterium]|nr:Ig-like domain-containing protein [Lachnospiraceae bacterium]